MKYMLFKLMWIVVMVGVLFCPGCKKTDESSDINLWYRWEWVQSSGGIAGEVLTPQSEGYTQAVEFEENGAYTKYRNNAVVTSGTYTINRAVSILDGQEYDMVVFDDGSPTQAIALVNERNLILREDCFDCYTHNYQR